MRKKGSVWWCWEGWIQGLWLAGKYYGESSLIQGFPAKPSCLSRLSLAFRCDDNDVSFSRSPRRTDEWRLLAFNWPSSILYPHVIRAFSLSSPAVPRDDKPHASRLRVGRCWPAKLYVWPFYLWSQETRLTLQENVLFIHSKLGWIRSKRPDFSKGGFSFHGSLRLHLDTSIYAFLFIESTRTRKKSRKRMFYMCLGWVHHYLGAWAANDTRALIYG